MYCVFLVCVIVIFWFYVPKTWLTFIQFNKLVYKLTVHQKKRSVHTYRKIETFVYGWNWGLKVYNKIKKTNKIIDNSMIIIIVISHKSSRQTKQCFHMCDFKLYSSACAVFPFKILERIFGLRWPTYIGLKDGSIYTWTFSSRTGPRCPNLKDFLYVCTQFNLYFKFWFGKSYWIITSTILTPKNKNNCIRTKCFTSKYNKNFFSRLFNIHQHLIPPSLPITITTVQSPVCFALDPVGIKRKKKRNDIPFNT